MRDLKTILTEDGNFSTNKISKEFIAETAKICSTYLTGEWSNVKDDDIVIESILGGNSNHVFKVSMISNKEKPVLLRIYGTNIIDEIFKDTLVFSILSEKKLGPKLLGYFPGGRLEEYIESRSLTTKELGYPSVIRLLAKKVANIHSLEVPLAKSANIFELIKNEIKTFKEVLGENHTFNVIPSKVSNRHCPSTINIKELEEEIQFLENMTKEYNSKIAFSHNDIFEGNIIVRKDAIIEKDQIISNNVDDSLIVIDFEYCCYNFIAFDLAQIFAETAITYDDDCECGYNIEEKDFLNDERLLIFINEYLNEKNKNNGEVEVDINKLQKEANKLMKETKTFVLIVHIFWGVWNIRQSFKSSIKNYDFMKHGLDRFVLYFNQKHQFLNEQ
uniref:Choline/ethanolamine kinase n=1 Tax=Parastrongyloides trichosuri TaxID=131310 RepID=A0A0N4Z3L1_PARTI